jgi:hypothetical protein
MVGPELLDPGQVLDFGFLCPHFVGEFQFGELAEQALSLKQIVALISRQLGLRGVDLKDEVLQLGLKLTPTSFTIGSQIVFDFGHSLEPSGLKLGEWRDGNWRGTGERRTG